MLRRMDLRQKDPERQRLGRLGALTVHARGRTNTGPARVAWEAGLAAEFGITDELSEGERQKRLEAAMRVRMARLAMTRWQKRTAGPTKPTVPEVRDASARPPEAA
jgi:hypothetical protein